MLFSCQIFNSDWVVEWAVVQYNNYIFPVSMSFSSNLDKYLKNEIEYYRRVKLPDTYCKATTRVGSRRAKKCNLLYEIWVSYDWLFSRSRLTSRLKILLWKRSPIKVINFHSCIAQHTNIFSHKMTTGIFRFTSLINSENVFLPTKTLHSKYSI